jgi:hypothetical protein
MYTHYMRVTYPNVDDNMLALLLSVVPTLKITVPLHLEESETGHGGSKCPTLLSVVQLTQLYFVSTCPQ